jgi:hypothetical protein
VVLLGNTELIQPLAHSTWPAWGDDALPDGAEFHLVTDVEDPALPGQDDELVLARAKAMLTSDAPPRLMVINLHQSDRAAHFGEANDYQEGVATVDEALASFVKWIRKDGRTKDFTHVIITADHGRHHDSDTDPAWRNHGDSCLGCRELPFLLLGPGARAGETIDTPMQLVDLGATIAELLGVPLPYADGRVATEMFVTDIPAGREGVAEARRADGRSVEVVYTLEAGRRTVVVADGDELSNPDALASESLATFEVDGHTEACWRSFVPDPDADDAPWVVECFASSDGSWVPAPVPVVKAGPFWHGVVADAGGAPWMAWVNNPNGIVQPGLAGVDEVLLQVARRGADSWGVPLDVPLSGSFPTFPALATDGTVGVLAVSASPSTSDGRYHRQIWLGTLDLAGEVAVPAGGWRQVDLGLDAWRLERPALSLVGAQVSLAALGTQEWAHAVVVVRSHDGGASWDPAVTVTAGASVLPHVGPATWGDRFRFLAYDGTDALGCSVTLDGDDVRCVALGGEHVLGWEEDGEDLVAVVRDDDEAWTAVPVDGDALR